MNMTQATYDRIRRAMNSAPADSWKRSNLAAQDIRDLLEAYEESVELLDECQNIGIDHPTHQRNVESFLYTDSGEPRAAAERAGACSSDLACFAAIAGNAVATQRARTADAEAAQLRERLTTAEHARCEQAAQLAEARAELTRYREQARSACAREMRDQIEHQGACNTCEEDLERWAFSFEAIQCMRVEAEAQLAEANEQADGHYSKCLELADTIRALRAELAEAQLTEACKAGRKVRTEKQDDGKQ